VFIYFTPIVFLEYSGGGGSTGGELEAEISVFAVATAWAGCLGEVFGAGVATAPFFGSGAARTMELTSKIIMITKAMTRMTITNDKKDHNNSIYNLSSQLHYIHSI
jgi:hypothetical protein